MLKGSYALSYHSGNFFFYLMEYMMFVRPKSCDVALTMFISWYLPSILLFCSSNLHCILSGLLPIIGHLKYCGEALDTLESAEHVKQLALESVEHVKQLAREQKCIEVDIDGKH